jgi:DNA-directed RNA polymerase subunit M/transcription elongation factor TFIIS
MKLMKHNYCKKLMKLYRQGKIRTASLTEADIYHDGWCAINKGGYCNCDPDIELRSFPGSNGGANGHTHEDADSVQGSTIEETRPLQPPTAPCPHCGSKEFILWQAANDPKNLSISCDGCGAVLSSTHPLDPDDRPMRRP